MGKLVEPGGWIASRCGEDVMSEIHTDCRAEEGVTVGLIEALISICRVLRHRDLSAGVVKESLVDLAQDEDFLLFCPNELPGDAVRM